MTKEDLKQIKELLQENNKEIKVDLRSEFKEMLQENNKEIKVDLRSEFKEMLQENNKEIKVDLRSEFKEMLQENNSILRDEIKDSAKSLRTEFKELLQENNKVIRKEIQDSAKDLRKEFKEMLVENNQVLKDDIITELGGVISTAFTEHEENNKEYFDAIESQFVETGRRFDKIENTLADQPTRADVQKWADENVIPYQKDVDRLKFLNIKALKNVPDNITIREQLVEEGLV